RPAARTAHRHHAGGARHGDPGCRGERHQDIGRPRNRPGDTGTMMDPNLPIAVTLTAGQWNTLLGLLAEVSAPWKLVNPLLNAIQSQCMAQDADQPNNIVPLPQAGE